MLILLKFFQIIEELRKLPNLFYETNITLISNTDNDKKKRKNYKPISLMNIDLKILNKVLASQIQ